MADPEKILKLRELREKVKGELASALIELGQVAKKETEVTEQQEGEVEQDIITETDEAVADEKGFLGKREEGKAEEQLKKTDEAIGAPAAAQAAEDAENVTHEVEEVDVVDLRTAKKQKAELKEEKKKLEKKKITLKEMREKIRRAIRLCEAQVNAGPGGNPYAEDNIKELNQIIADVRGKNDAIIKTDEHIRELHESLTKRKITARKLYSMRRSLGDRAKSAIARAERRKAP